MKLCFAANASREIGVGHAMRLISLAEVAKQRLIEFKFFGKFTEVPWLWNYMKTIGIEANEDLSKINDINSSEFTLIVDSYDKSFINELLNCSWKQTLLFLDEEFPMYDFTTYIHPTIECCYKTHINANFLCGKKYIPFRKKIEKIKPEIFDSPFVKSLLIISGGTDPHGMINGVLDEIEKIDLLKKIQVFVVADKSMVRKKKNLNLVILKPGVEIDAILKSGMAVITAAGITSLEMVAREIPIGIIKVSKNQDSNFESLARKELVLPVGSRGPAGSWIINLALIEKLLLDEETRNNLKIKMHNFIDLLGADRIISKIEAK